MWFVVRISSSTVKGRCVVNRSARKDSLYSLTNFEYRGTPSTRRRVANKITIHPSMFSCRPIFLCGQVRLANILRCRKNLFLVPSCRLWPGMMASYNCEVNEIHGETTIYEKICTSLAIDKYVWPSGSAVQIGTSYAFIFLTHMLTHCDSYPTVVQSAVIDTLE